MKKGEREEVRGDGRRERGVRKEKRSEERGKGVKKEERSNDRQKRWEEKGRRDEKGGKSE